MALVILYRCDVQLSIFHICTVDFVMGSKEACGEKSGNNYIAVIIAVILAVANAVFIGLLAAAKVWLRYSCL